MIIFSGATQVFYLLPTIDNNKRYLFHWTVEYFSGFLPETFISFCYSSFNKHNHNFSLLFIHYLSVFLWPTFSQMRSFLYKSIIGTWILAQLIKLKITLSYSLSIFFLCILITCERNIHFHLSISII